MEDVRNMICIPKKTTAVCVGTIITVFVVLLSLHVWAYENEPIRFRGTKWGTPIEKMHKMVLVADFGSSKYYKKKSEKMAMGAAKLESVIYGFYRGKFESVLIVFRSESNYSALKRIFFEHHGDGYGPDHPMIVFHWFGIDVNITMDYDHSEKHGSIKYSFKPIQKERERDIKAAAAQVDH